VELLTNLGYHSGVLINGEHPSAFNLNSCWTKNRHLYILINRHVKNPLQGLVPAMFSQVNGLILLLKNASTLFFEDVNVHAGSIDNSTINEQALMNAL
jgi:hypothetical protein